MDKTLTSFAAMNQASDTSKGNILVIDDTLDNVRLLSTLLTEQGYMVRKALNGQMGLKACQTLPPDLILLDINMPDISGYEVCQQLKLDENTAEIPVIFISALDDAADKVKAFDVGGNDYITKPFQRAEVMIRVENQLKRRSLQIQLQEQNCLLQQELRERLIIQEALQLSEANLKAQKQQLEQTLNELRQTQSQLIHNEKMASLGQLVAGIAHEINNPVSFIHGNLVYMSRYAQDLLNLVNLYQEEYLDASPKIQEAIEEIDLDFLMKDLQKMMDSMQTGVHRIQQIVHSLRNFSRLDEAEMKPVNIHEGIDSTLMLLQHRFMDTNKRPSIAVIKDYKELPKVICYASQINQVFMNLLSNAIDALDLQANHGKYKVPVKGEILMPQIQINTELTVTNTVKIQITDNGIGMNELVRARLFDPFFTTKPVGRGTGLGLSISYSIIVQQHHGKLTCNSSPGKGTEFVIEIPVNPLSTLGGRPGEFPQ